MTVKRINLTRLASCALLMVFLTAGLSPASVLAQEYKETYNAALEAAKAKNYTDARSKFAQAATQAQQAGDAEIAKQAKYVAAQIDYKLGNAAIKAENFDQALNHYQAGTAIYPEYDKNKYGEGLALKKLGRIDEALAAWQEAAKSSDRETARTAEGAIRDHFYFQASSAVSKQNATAADADRAVAALEASQEFAEPDADYYYYLGVAYKLKGQSSTCISNTDKALELHNGSRSDKAKIYFLKGECLMTTGNLAEAKTAFQNAAFGSYKAAAEDMINNRLN